MIEVNVVSFSSSDYTFYQKLLYASGASYWDRNILYVSAINKTLYAALYRECSSQVDGLEVSSTEKCYEIDSIGLLAHLSLPYNEPRSSSPPCIIRNPLQYLSVSV